MQGGAAWPPAPARVHNNLHVVAPDLHIVAKPPKKLKIPFWDFSYDVKKERKKKD